MYYDVVMMARMPGNEIEAMVHDAPPHVGSRHICWLSKILQEVVHNPVRQTVFFFYLRLKD